MQNIGGENAGDAFYRYKMPKLIAKVCLPEGLTCAFISIGVWAHFYTCTT
jgi:hypothetical protein